MTPEDESQTIGLCVYKANDQVHVKSHNQSCRSGNVDLVRSSTVPYGLIYSSCIYAQTEAAQMERTARALLYAGLSFGYASPTRVL